MQLVTSDLKSEHCFHRSTVHPSGRTGVPSPAPAPDMLRIAIDVGGDDVWLDAVAVDAAFVRSCQNRIQQVEKFSCLGPATLHCDGLHKPHGGVRVLSAVFPNAGRITLNVSGAWY